MTEASQGFADKQNEENGAALALAGIGRGVLKACIEAAQNHKNTFSKLTVIQVLKLMGPSAKEAVPSLRRIYENNSWSNTLMNHLCLKQSAAMQSEQLPATFLTLKF